MLPRSLLRATPHLAQASALMRLSLIISNLKMFMPQKCTSIQNLMNPSTLETKTIASKRVDAEYFQRSATSHHTILALRLEHLLCQY